MTWVLDKDAAADLHKDWLQIQDREDVDSVGADLARSTFLSHVRMFVTMDITRHEPHVRNFVNFLTDCTDAATRDIEFVITRVTEGRQVSTLHTSLIAELALHDAALPK